VYSGAYNIVADKTVKLWKVSERRKRTDGFNLRDEMGSPVDPSSITSLRVPVFKPMELMVEASPRRVFANAHTYHINSISVNSDGATYLSADDLRINLWHMENNDQSFSILAALFCVYRWAFTAVANWCDYAPAPNFVTAMNYNIFWIVLCAVPPASYFCSNLCSQFLGHITLAIDDSIVWTLVCRLAVQK